MLALASQKLLCLYNSHHPGRWAAGTVKSALFMQPSEALIRACMAWAAFRPSREPARAWRKGRKNLCAKGEGGRPLSGACCCRRAA